MIDPQAIEAAARAIDPSAWVDDLHFHTPNMCIRRDNVRYLARTAIAAFLEASGVGRDKDRLDWLSERFDCKWDATINRAPYWYMAGHLRGESLREAIDAARGGEHV